ncbi:hypothetical protein [Frankia sp. CiP1_Cm_nod2]|uniref:hypothetical protein n=1 Tax=Frankia sp. CiP1_Cm_nod2 TaxID=2897161 RepID=UPI002024E0F0
MVGQIAKYLFGKFPAGPWTLAAQAVWALLLLWVGYWLAVVVCRKTVPWLLRESVGPGRTAVSGLRYLGLLIDYGQATACCKLGLRPVYWFGMLIDDLARVADRFVRRLPRYAAAPRRFSRGLAVLVVCATLLSWNGSRCASGHDQSCVHPIRQWANDVDREWSQVNSSTPSVSERPHPSRQ